MPPFPAQFEALLTASGRRLLRGDTDSPGPWVDRRRATALAAHLEADLAPGLERVDLRLPPATAATEAFADAVPRVGRYHRVPAPALTGHPLHALLTGDAPRQLAERLSGEPLHGPPTLEVLCFAPGDSIGPSPGPRGVRLELTCATDDVTHQLLLVERNEQLEASAVIWKSGTLWALRFPRWHTITPLQGRTAKARRWALQMTWPGAAP